MRRNILVLWFALLIVSCGSGSSGGADAVGSDESSVIPGADALDAFEATPPPECLVDADCAARGDTYACNCEGKCIVAACRTDVNCGSEAWCDDCDKVCKPRMPQCASCTADRECAGAMSRCVSKVTYAGVDITFENRVCAEWCPLSTGVCMIEGAPQGAYVCAKVQDETNGACIPESLDCGDVPVACKTDDDCEDPVTQKCYEDLRICGCRDVTSCAFGQACHPLTHQCVPGCSDDLECGLSRVCEAGLCITACSGELASGNVTNCPATTPKPDTNWDCKDGHCRIPGMCFGALDCPEPATYCDIAQSECKPGCLTDFDCKSAAQECSGTVCVQRGCTRNFECAFKQVCDQQTGQCKEAEGKYCDVCDPQAENACGDEDTLCVSFQDEDGADKGSYCMPPCSDDPKNACPQGWQCEEIQDTTGSSHGKKCIRFCYVEVQM